MTKTRLTELDLILKAGRILTESGAEVFRIEETMAHMALALGVTDFNASVINRAIMVSGESQKNYQEARVTSTGSTSINLKKLEAINHLSRTLVANPHMPLDTIKARLNQIEKSVEYSFLIILIAYFIGAGAFSLSLGSSLKDSLISATAGALAGWSLTTLTRYIHTSYLLTIAASSVITLIANIAFLTDISDKRSLIILGALMILVPGAVFVNAIREFAQNNFLLGTSLLISALLTCSSISAGVAATTEILPFADQLTNNFSLNYSNWLDLLFKTLMAGIGTISFAILYHAPKRYLAYIGMLSGTSWLLYLLISKLVTLDILATIAPAILLALSSRILAAHLKAPTTIFLVTSIFPLIPGLSIYRAVYFLLIGQNGLAWEFFRSSFIIAFAITIAISLTQQIPMKYLHKLLKSLKKA